MCNNYGYTLDKKIIPSHKGIQGISSNLYVTIIVTTRTDVNTSVSNVTKIVTA